MNTPFIPHVNTKSSHKTQNIEENTQDFTKDVQTNHQIFGRDIETTI